MRRFSAILFLSILLFNFYGYRLMIDYMQDKYAGMLQSNLDKENYNEEELIRIKMPLNLPYYTASFNFERAYGSVEVNGIVYEYVKRRVCQDTLELLCLPDRTKTSLQSIENELLKMSANSVPDKKQANLKPVFPDFFQYICTYTVTAFSETLPLFFLTNSRIRLADYTSQTERPPNPGSAL